MVNPARGWLITRQAVLVVAGWLLFAAALVTRNPLFKALCLVAARALPHVLETRAAKLRTAVR